MNDKETIGGYEIPTTYPELLKAFKELYFDVDDLHRQIAESEKDRIDDKRELARQRRAIIGFTEKLDCIKSNSHRLEINEYLRLSVGSVAVSKVGSETQNSTNGNYQHGLKKGAIGVITGFGVGLAPFVNFLYNGSTYQLDYDQIRVLHEITVIPSQEKGT